MLKKYLIFLLVLISASSAISQELKKVSFVPLWIPQAQFTGFYVAQEKGIYKKFGIDLEIVSSGVEVSTSELLSEGKVDFALLWLANAIQLKARGIKIVNLAQLVNRSSLMLISKVSSGIKTPQDMIGKKVGIWGGDFQIQPMSFFEKFDIDVRIIHQGNSINLFLFDGIDVTSAMWYNEYNTIINSGINKDELNTFFFADYGLNFPEEGIYCTEEFFMKNPELSKKFVEATFEGWIYAFDHPEEAIDIVIKYKKLANLPYNKPHQRWMFSQMQNLMFPSKKMHQFEILSEESFLFVSNILMNKGLINAIPDYKQFYKPQMLKTDK